LLGNRLVVVLTAGYSLSLMGCPRPAPLPPPAALPFIGVTTTLAVVEDAAIVAALVPLKSQWKAATGGKLEVVTISRDQLLASRNAAEVHADAIVYPPRLLGQLAERDWLLPLNWLGLASSNYCRCAAPLGELELWPFHSVRRC
jgi:hypothetical protein